MVKVKVLYDIVFIDCLDLPVDSGLLYYKWKRGRRKNVGSQVIVSPKCIASWNESVTVLSNAKVKDGRLKNKEFQISVHHVSSNNKDRKLGDITINLAEFTTYESQIINTQKSVTKAISSSFKGKKCEIKLLLCVKVGSENDFHLRNVNGTTHNVYIDEDTDASYVRSQQDNISKISSDSGDRDDVCKDLTSDIPTPKVVQPVSLTILETKSKKVPPPVISVMDVEDSNPFEGAVAPGEEVEIVLNASEDLVSESPKFQKAVSKRVLDPEVVPDSAELKQTEEQIATIREKILQNIKIEEFNLMVDSSITSIYPRFVCEMPLSSVIIYECLRYWKFFDSPPDKGTHEGFTKIAHSIVETCEREVKSTSVLAYWLSCTQALFTACTLEYPQQCMPLRNDILNLVNAEILTRLGKVGHIPLDNTDKDNAIYEFQTSLCWSAAEVYKLLFENLVNSFISLKDVLFSNVEVEDEKAIPHEVYNGLVKAISPPKLQNNSTMDRICCIFDHYLHHFQMNCVSDELCSQWAFQAFVFIDYTVFNHVIASKMTVDIAMRLKRRIAVLERWSDEQKHFLIGRPKQCLQYSRQAINVLLVADKQQFGSREFRQVTCPYLTDAHVAQLLQNISSEAPRYECPPLSCSVDDLYAPLLWTAKLPVPRSRDRNHINSLGKPKVAALKLWDQAQVKPRTSSWSPTLTPDILPGLLRDNSSFSFLTM